MPDFQQNVVDLLNARDNAVSKVGQDGMQEAQEDFARKADQAGRQRGAEGEALIEALREEVARKTSAHRDPFRED